MKSPLELSHAFLETVLNQEAYALDATMGNGHDTLFLAQKAKQVYAFDIQQKALEATYKRLNDAKELDKVNLYWSGHENIDRYVAVPLQAAIFNLGYLPGCDKTIATKAKTTLIALDKVLKLLDKKGRLAIMVYPGHKEGAIEQEAIRQWACDLDQKQYTVMQYQALNQVNTPPFLIMIEKQLGEQ